MRLKKTIKDVESFVSDYCLCSGNVINISTEEEIKNIKSQSEILTFGKNNIIIRDIRGNSIIIDSSNRIVNNTFKIDAITYPYFTFYGFNNQDIEGVFNFSKQKVLFEAKAWLGRDIIKDYIFTDDIICRDINNGEVLWQFDILSIGNNPHNDVYNKEADWEVKKFIGVLEDKLWIALNHYTIIALDLKTGQLVHRIDRIANFKYDWLPSYIPLPAATVIDEKNNKLIGFMWEFYWEINPVNGEITLIDLTNELLPQKIRNDREDFVLTDNYIYFASNSDIKVGALNRNTKKVDWFYAFEDNEIGYQSRISKIDGNDEKLGVLTNEKVLYIFEKE